MAAGPRDAVPGGGRVFISYRRQDSAWPARQLYEALAARFGASNIFKDVDDIEPGEDFVDKITAAVAQCDVLLALIGPHWMSMADGKGQRRLDDPEDFVRVEIGAALARNVRVIPILIDGAPMPPAAELTPDLAPMVRRQAVAIDPVSFNTERLFATLADIFEAQATAAAQAAAEVASRTEAARAAERREKSRASAGCQGRGCASRECAAGGRASGPGQGRGRASRESEAGGRASGPGQGRGRSRGGDGCGGESRDGHDGCADDGRGEPPGRVRPPFVHGAGRAAGGPAEIGTAADAGRGAGCRRGGGGTAGHPVDLAALDEQQQRRLRSCATGQRATVHDPTVHLRVRPRLGEPDDPSERGG